MAMKNVMGIIYTGERDSYLRELTLMRAIAALPVAGRYRVIDFLVSGLVNSGVKNVGVIMQKNYHSLMDHLGSGKEWDLHGKNDGLYILPPFLTRENVGVYNGSLDALHSNSGYLRRSKQEYVLLCNSLIVFNANFSDMLETHLRSEADVTILYSKSPNLRRPEYGTYFEVNSEGIITDVEIDPTRPRYENACMEVYLLRKDLLMDLVDRGAAHGYHDINRDVFQRMIRDAGIRMAGYEYTDVCYRMDSVQSYFNFNMDVLDARVRHSLFSEEKPVYTKVRDEMPARYLEHARVVNTMVADGCIVDGNVEHSMLFRGVRIGKGARIKNCVIMQDSVIEEDVTLENCILDKQAVIKRGGKLIGPSTYPIVISKDMTI
ncbi:MAG: glucose-1-phosphate adenylyltransferase subunit GlgD [Candidatus Limiplasma sp.]|nr:glucose-1-phosphate adenylyltransferase subunit GlgD [Candidatus Limiplasma sp.]MEA5146514.1 glucose-1-phosphate adenylyltransferase subunit GlgD [Candidatus Limiplasma sp.]